ncbi:MAG TPA: V-type ATP synthase subunit A [Anaeromyxobacteraceae bacterium]|nr:V-type ATP synthase subunit A [Anaeromyxobacteraceae bacterium]
MTGTLIGVSGCTAAARGLGPVGMDEVVLAGAQRLPAEVIRVQGDVVTLQVYEDTTGLGLGEPAQATGAPLAVELGPGLLGEIYDGLQRPLAALAAAGGDFIARGITAPALDRKRRWVFTPCVKPGDHVVGGQRLGTARDAATRLEEPVLVPPDVDAVVADALAGTVSVDEPVVELRGGGTLSLLHRWPVRRPRPFRTRLSPEVPLLTGQRVLDCFFPVALGSAAIVPGGFGTGKTVLEQSLARFAAADVIVYVGCGERGNEMADVLSEFPQLVDPRTQRPLMERTVMVVNTSNMPVAGREASMYTGMAIAEYFRDQGKRVAILIDSTSRWAEALREISARLEEMPGEEGYPTYLASRISSFYERAGRVVPLSGEGEGSVTAVGAVSPPGGDFSEPVTQGSLRATTTLWALSADLAHRRHFPAIDWIQSWSLDAERLDAWFTREAGSEWHDLRAEAMRLLQREQDIAEVAELVGIDALQDAERLTLESARRVREGFLRQNAYHDVDATCSPAKALAMLRILLGAHQRATDALAKGATLKAVLSPEIDEKLLRLGETPADRMDQAKADVDAAFDAALARDRE